MVRSSSGVGAKRGAQRWRGTGRWCYEVRAKRRGVDETVPATRGAELDQTTSAPPSVRWRLVVAARSNNGVRRLRIERRVKLRRCLVWQQKITSETPSAAAERFHSPQTSL
ncbi:hypothetical protein U1Q18_049567 [Sarracenia purpurea var. burkii]